MEQMHTASEAELQRLESEIAALDEQLAAAQAPSQRPAGATLHGD